MSQILDPLKDKENSIICCYVNATSQIQIARVTNVPNWYFERVVFPGQRLVFEANPEGTLEIHTGMMASAILSNTIPCKRLALQAVKEEPRQEKKHTTAKSDKDNTVSINNSPTQDKADLSINVAV